MPPPSTLPTRWTATRAARDQRRSARDVQDCVGLPVSVPQQFDRFLCSHHDNFDSAASGFFEHGRHHGHRALCPSSDDQARALPRDLFFHREGRVAVLVAKLLRGFLLPPKNLAPVDDDVALVLIAVDADGAESKPVDSHAFRVGRAPSGTLPPRRRSYPLGAGRAAASVRREFQHGPAPRQWLRPLARRHLPDSWRRDWIWDRCLRLRARLRPVELPHELLHVSSTQSDSLSRRMNAESSVRLDRQRDARRSGCGDGPNAMIGDPTGWASSFGPTSSTTVPAEPSTVTR